MASVPTMETLLHFLFDWAKNSPKDVAHRWQDGAELRSRTAEELMNDVVGLSLALEHKGFKSSDVGCIFAYNSSDWVALDLALMLCGGASAGIYLNASRSQFEYILLHTNAKILLVDRLEDLQRVCDVKDVFVRFSNLELILIRSDLSIDSPDLSSSSKILKFADFIEYGRSLVAGKTKSPIQVGLEKLQRINAQDLATLIYTSGTTGNPKGVMLSGASLAFAARAYSSTWEPPKIGNLYSFLPLSHIAERMSTVGLGLSLRYLVHFSSGPMAVPTELREQQPSILLCVPRLWEKLSEGVEQKIRKMPERRQRLIRWAMGQESRFMKKRLKGDPVSIREWLSHLIADRLVLQKIRQQMGLSRVLRAASGAAALSAKTHSWYLGIGIHIIEAYALSESAGVLAGGVGTEDTSGTVGKVYPGIEMRMAPDGEIEIRGPNVFMGYYRDEEATAQIMQKDWLQTGDLGELTAEGYLKIVGRKREIIKTNEGKMISPALVESKILAHSLIEQAVVFGSERSHLVALIALNWELAKLESNFESILREHFRQLNSELASHERVKKYEIIKEGFTIENEEMTATMKLRRHIIEKRYRHRIEGLYDSTKAESSSHL